MHDSGNARHVGRHRAPTAPRASYAVIVTTAVVGASAAALAVGSTLPAASSAASSSALKPDSSQFTDAGAALGAPGDGASGDGATGDSSRSAPSRASRSQRRAGVSDPEALPVWVRPAAGPLSSLFAARWGTFHYGIDIAAGYGSTVHAASAGTVIRSGWYGGYGQIVIIDHGDGVTTRYGHNSQLLVAVGDHVDAGTPIAKVGSTGASTGPHCHFEVRIDDKPEDPLPWLEEHGVSMTGVNTDL